VLPSAADSRSTASIIAATGASIPPSAAGMAMRLMPVSRIAFTTSSGSRRPASISSARAATSGATAPTAATMSAVLTAMPVTSAPRDRPVIAPPLVRGRAG
jgi:hypothetical protein